MNVFYRLREIKFRAIRIITDIDNLMAELGTEIKEEYVKKRNGKKNKGKKEQRELVKEK